MACRQKRELTNEGREIKKKLIDMNMTQAEFCRRHGIAENRFCDVIRGEKKYKRTERRILELFEMKGGEDDGMGKAVGGGRA